jgi:phosphoserine phosphatase
MPRIKFAFFDVDGTLKIERDPYVYLHQKLGTAEQGQAHFEMAQRGEIDYDQWGQLDAGLWANQESSYISQLFSQIPWVPGAKVLIGHLHEFGAQIVLISSGMNLHVDPLAGDIEAFAAFSNILVVADGRLTGELQIVVPEEGKGEITTRIMQQHGVEPSECIAFGDGPADAHMFRQVGWSVAVAPHHDSVSQAASFTLNIPDLTPAIPELLAYATR